MGRVIRRNSKSNTLYIETSMNIIFQKIEYSEKQSPLFEKRSYATPNYIMMKTNNFCFDQTFADP